ncbi:hypothetical protein LUU34_00690000 [Aix galericulata]|nr:hypothetical protein LUU34_00690000 [Aix galericulata]
MPLSQPPQPPPAAQSAPPPAPCSPLIGWRFGASNSRALPLRSHWLAPGGWRETSRVWRQAGSAAAALRFGACTGS